MKSPVVICGATGNVGSKIAGTLLAAGESVRVVGRERVRLGPLAARGAESFPGDTADAAFLGKAFAGARAAFVLIPPNYGAEDIGQYQRQVAEALVSALSAARVPRIVTLSSIGAHLAEGTGPILGLHELESMLDVRLPDAGVVHLRPGFFMENHLWSIPLIREHGVNGSPIRPDLPIPMVATKDVANAAARLLDYGTFAGHSVRYLLGPRDLTLSDATRILGEATGAPGLKYVRFPEDDARKAMAAMGLSASAVDAMLEMQRGFNAGHIRPTRERDADSATPTTLEEFATTVFARAYDAAA
jgi:uncharacterized protein YbjT (DUF2867 family)